MEFCHWDILLSLGPFAVSLPVRVSFLLKLPDIGQDAADVQIWSALAGLKDFSHLVRTSGAAMGVPCKHRHSETLKGENICGDDGGYLRRICSYISVLPSDLHSQVRSFTQVGRLKLGGMPHCAGSVFQTLLPTPHAPGVWGWRTGPSWGSLWPGEHLGGWPLHS